MTPAMVERVARAIYESMPQGWTWPNWEKLSPEIQEAYGRSARAAIEAYEIAINEGK